VAPRLGELRVPALLLNSEGDPMVPAKVVRSVLNGSARRLEVRWVAGGGHVSFPRRLDVGLTDRLGTEATDGLGVDAQVLGWLRRQ
jgi:predicted alpha/beta-fold hydrolase